MFNNCGVIHIEKIKLSEEEYLKLQLMQEQKIVTTLNNFHEIITEKEDFYKIKTEIEKKLENFAYSAIEWRALNYLNLDKEQNEKMIEVLNNLRRIR